MPQEIEKLDFEVNVDEASPDDEKVRAVAPAVDNPSQEPLRRISAELRGDDAVEADMMETMLRIHEIGRTKVERDSALVRLAMMALGRAVEDCRKATGKRFPSAQDIETFVRD